MILSDQTIRYMIKTGVLSIDPMCDKTIQPASIDLRIGDQFLFPKTKQTGSKLEKEYTSTDDSGNIFHQKYSSNGVLSLKDKIEYSKIKSPEIGLPPKCFALATTMEYIKLPKNIGAIIQGRSSIGRAGLFIENAGWIDPGFEGQITLELYNANNSHLMIQAGIRVCQLILFEIDKVPTNLYNGKYQKQRGVTGSKIHEDSQ